MGLQLSETFDKTHGRQPTPEELTALCQKTVLDRGLILAQKGLGDHRKPNFLVDEELVIHSIFHAILTGSETTILTRDRDVIEQFYKAIYLIDTHYRSMLIAQSYAAYPDNVITDLLPTTPSMTDVFEEVPTTLHLPRHFKKWVLPSEWRFVNLYCKLFGGPENQMRVTHLTFSAEREMQSILEMKGSTHGRKHGQSRWTELRNSHFSPILKSSWRSCGSSR